MSLNITTDENHPEQRDQPRRRRSWRRGGSSTARWGSKSLGVCAVGLGLAIVAAVALPMILPATWATPVTTLVLWTFLALPVIHGLSRSIPRGLFRFRSVDLLYGIVLGALVRVVQGLTEIAVRGSAPPVPSYPTVYGALPVERWLTDMVSGVVVGPLIEEMFFRCALLVAVYTVVRRRWGATVGTWAAVGVTTLLFVVSHALIAPTSPDQLIALTLLGLTCGLLVVRTGRIWGAVLAHMTYNAILLALTLAATVLA